MRRGGHGFDGTDTCFHEYVGADAGISWHFTGKVCGIFTAGRPWRRNVRISAAGHYRPAFGKRPGFGEGAADTGPVVWRYICGR